jgi:alpha-glucoside transport system substrate-binding protein
VRATIARLARLLLVLGLCATPLACGGAASNATVTILIPWEKQGDVSEYDAFNAVVRQFELKSGIHVVLQTTRDETRQLDADLAVGDPPDVADFSSPGAAGQYKQYLRSLDVDLNNYAEPWRSLAMLGTSKVYTVPVKADVQSLLWRSTATVRSAPENMAALERLSRHGTPWCLGLASGPASGWPGASWIADILLSSSQSGAYRNWLNGTLPWDSGQVRGAWQEWGALLHNGAAVAGGARGALTTPFNQALGADGCELEHGALIATGLTSTGPTSTADYDYTHFPPGSGGASPILVSGDFMGLFTGNKNARKLLGYLASQEAQTLWVSQPTGDAFSADTAVKSGSYPHGVEQDIAGLLLGNQATRCFNAEDLMRPDVSVAFSQAVLEYVNNSSSLDVSLRGLQLTQKGAGSSKVWKQACSD